MSTTPKEGENRPLPLDAPISSAETPVYAAQPKPDPLPRSFTIAALLSYIPAYIYVRWILFFRGFVGWGLLGFAALFVAGVDGFARAEKRTAAPETKLWATCYLLLSVFLPLWGYQAGGLGAWQTLAWHMFAIWYVLARCGMLAQGHSGLLIWLDAVAGTLTIPWSGIYLRVVALAQGLRRGLSKRIPNTNDAKKRLVTVLGSVAVTLVLCVIVWGQLAAVDETFAAIGRQLLRGLDIFSWRLTTEDTIHIVLSLPVGAWLYGLTAGSLKRKEAPCTAQGFYTWLAPLQKLPRFTVCLTMGALCAVYTLFFTVQALAYIRSVFSPGMNITTVSRYAVDGFWELCRVLMLNFGLLAAVRFLGPNLLRENRAVKILAAVFCLFGLGFVALAAFKLGVYIHLYAFTPRRVISGWFLCVLAVWAVLALLWVLGVKVPLGHARLGISFFVLWFVLLAAVNMNRQIIRLNIDRYAAGQDTGLEASVLRDCGILEYNSAQAKNNVTYAQWLIDAGWFEGNTVEEIRRLYDADEFYLEKPLTTAKVNLGRGMLLRMTFDADVCTGAQVVEKS